MVLLSTNIWISLSVKSNTPSCLETYIKKQSILNGLHFANNKK